MPIHLKINIRTKIIFSYVLVLLCLGVFLWIVSGHLSALQKEAATIGENDIEILRLTHDIEKNLLEMETGQRGFVITGDPAYLKPYKEAMSTWEMNYNKLHQMIKDNPSQANQLEQIKGNVEKWIEVAGQPAVRLKQAGQDEEALHFFINDPGQPAMEALRSQFSAFRSAERQMTADRVAAMNHSNMDLMITLYALWAAVAFATVAAAYLISRSIVRPITEVTGMISEIAEGGNLSRQIKVSSRDEIYDLAENTNKLLSQVSRQAWVKDQVQVMSALLQNADHQNTLYRLFIHRTAGVLGVPYAALFLNRKDREMVKAAAFADPDGEPWDKVRDRFLPGEGFVGQCMVEKRMLRFDDLPANYIRIESGLGDAEPQSIVTAPVLYEGRVLAVVELALFKPMDEQREQLLDQLLLVFATVLNTMNNKIAMEELYRESQALNEELQVQSEELQAQTQELQLSASETQLLNERLKTQKEAAEQAAKEVELYAVQIEQSSRYKSQFLANMSHELRTPLNSMLILSQILAENKNGTLSEEEQNYASVIHKSGNELLMLINDILDLSKVEAGKMQIEQELVNLTELPEMMEDTFKKTADSKHLRFEIEVEPSVPDLIYSDGMRLHQILRNLISNAIKFTDQGFVKLTIRVRDGIRLNDYVLNEKAVVFEVSDSGIGISEDKLKLIFEAFTQGDETTARKFGGTGLGLSISLQLARLLGGHISVDSKVGGGSRFTLYLPVGGHQGCEQENMFIIPEAAAGAEKMNRWEELPKLGQEDGGDEISQLEGRIVLIVDDDIRNVYGLTNSLEKIGMRVLTAQHGYECLEILEGDDQVDVVLLDIMMPEMDGLETLKRIRENPAYQDLPVIVLTAKAMKEVREKCLDAGASGYMSKPAALGDIITAIRASLMDFQFADNRID